MSRPNTAPTLTMPVVVTDPGIPVAPLAVERSITAIPNPLPTWDALEQYAADPAVNRQDLVGLTWIQDGKHSVISNNVRVQRMVDVPIPQGTVARWRHKEPETKQELQRVEELTVDVYDDRNDLVSMLPITRQELQDRIYGRDKPTGFGWEDKPATSSDFEKVAVHLTPNKDPFDSALEQALLLGERILGGERTNGQKGLEGLHWTYLHYNKNLVTGKDVGRGVTRTAEIVRDDVVNIVTTSREMKQVRIQMAHIKDADGNVIENKMFVDNKLREHFKAIDTSDEVYLDLHFKNYKPAVEVTKVAIGARPGFLGSMALSGHVELTGTEAPEIITNALEQNAQKLQELMKRETASMPWNFAGEDALALWMLSRLDRKTGNATADGQKMGEKFKNAVHTVEGRQRAEVLKTLINNYGLAAVFERGVELQHAHLEALNKLQAKPDPEAQELSRVFEAMADRFFYAGQPRAAGVAQAGMKFGDTFGRDKASAHVVSQNIVDELVGISYLYNRIQSATQTQKTGEVDASGQPIERPREFFGFNVGLSRHLQDYHMQDHIVRQVEPLVRQIMEAKRNEKAPNPAHAIRLGSLLRSSVVHQ